MRCRHEFAWRPEQCLAVQVNIKRSFSYAIWNKGTDRGQLSGVASWPIGASNPQKHMLKICQEEMYFVNAVIVFRFQTFRIDDFRVTDHEQRIPLKRFVLLLRDTMNCQSTPLSVPLPSAWRSCVLFNATISHQSLS